MPLTLLLVLIFSFGSSVNAQSISSTSRVPPIQHNGKSGYIDGNGKIVIKPQFVWAEEFSEGLAAVENEDGKPRYIDQNGRVVIDDEEILTPLTAEERLLEPRDIILNQPDFVADLNFFIGEGFGGYGGAERLARKGNKYREESQFWIFIGELRKPSARLFPQSKSYDDFESARGGSADRTPINPQELAKENGVSFTALGTRVIDGHNCLKIEASRKGKAEKFYFYAARDLKNLVIVAQIIEPRRSTLQRLSNISLDVPDSLVQIPLDYQPIEHDRWVKLENAKLTYGGKASKDFVVFRAAGGQLFVRVNDAPYPWDYLVRPKEATVETAFQGLIVTRSGEYIWQTKESEGFSQTYYRTPRPRSEWEKEENKRVIVKPNSVTFRSNDYNKTKALIEVRW